MGRSYAAPIVAAALVLASLAVPYAAGYMCLASRFAECQPAQTRQRFFPAEWMAVVFKPAAALVEDLCTPLKVTAEAE